MKHPARSALTALIAAALLTLPLRAFLSLLPRAAGQVLEELLLYGLPGLLLIRRERRRPNLGLALTAVPTGMLLQFLLGYVTLLAMQLFPSDLVALPAPETLGGWVLQILVLVLVPAFAEELFFRGVLCRALAEEQGAARGIVLSALLFTLLHGQLTAAPALFLFALLLGLCLLTTNSLLLCMLLHAGFNLCGLLLPIWPEQTISYAMVFCGLSGIIFCLLWRKHRTPMNPPTAAADPLIRLMIPAACCAALLLYFL